MKIKKVLPLDLDDTKKIFKFEANLTAFEVLVAYNNKIDLKSRILQSNRYNFHDRLNKKEEIRKEGNIFYKNGEWFIKKTVQPRPYEVINKIIIGSQNIV